MAQPLRVLIVEDSEDDAQLLLRYLTRGGYEVSWERVDAPSAMRAALDKQHWDVIFADYTMPHFSAVAALSVLKEEPRDIPFIIVSGSIGEDLAVTAMKSGADDYIMKNNPTRLIPALQRELREAEGRRARRQAEEITQRLAGILEATPDFVGTADKDYQVIYVNRAGRLMTGWSETEDLTHATITDFHPLWAARLILHDAIPHAIRTGSWVGETMLLTKDGREIPISQVIIAHKDMNGSVEWLSTIARDITDQKRSEQEIRIAQNKYQSIFENAVEGITQLKKDGTIITANPAMSRITGYDSPQELIDAVALGRDLFVSPEDRETFMRILATEDLVQGFECEHYRKDQSKVWVSISGRAVRREDGSFINFEMSVEDVTDKKQLEAQLLQSQKMEAVGRLAGGVAHDFNNLLTAIIGYSQMMLSRSDLSDQLRHETQEILQAGQRAAALTGQLLAFSRRQTIVRKQVDLAQTVSDLARMIKRIIGEDVEVRVRTDAPLPPILADAGQVEQIIMNLAVNARDAMPGGGRLTIETSFVKLDEAYCRDHPWAQPGRYGVVTVSDNGTGMDEETQRRIFEPFFTTKEPGRGTGLGLSVVYGIVQQHDGFIHVYSEVSEGTTFRIYLPTVEAPQSADASQPISEARGGTETILIAEDEETLRELAKSVLEEMGYNVLLARDGLEAVELFKAHRDSIDLVMLDLVMPRLGGMEALKTLQNLGARIPAIFMTGYAPETTHGDLLEQTGVALIQKPYGLTDFAQKVREVLDQPKN